MVSMIAAMGLKQEIGRNNDLLWHLPDDFKWFVKHTKGKSIIMGRNTMLSLGKPLKNRRNMVLSSNSENIIDGFEHRYSLDETLNDLREEPEVMIIGGGKLYQSALNLATRLYITRVNAEFEGADTFFPEFKDDEWKVSYCEEHAIDEKHAYPFAFYIYDRI